MKIPFSKATFGKEEKRAISECIDSGWTVLGPKTLEFEEAFAKYVGAKYAVFVDSGTAALHLAVYVSNYKQDCIRIPSLTFVSDAEIAYHNKLRIDFVDINKDTLCIDRQIANCLPTNFAGELAKCRGPVIDSCHRIEKDDVQKRPTSLWCYSFYTTKNMSTVQGGMIVLNSKRKYKNLLMLRDHGITKGTKQRYEGKNPLYDIKFPGYRVKGDDLRASIGLEQLKKLPKITKRRNEIVDKYNKNLGYNRIGNHLYPILVNDRDKFIKTMIRQGIQVSVHFPPIHKFTAYKQNVKLPVTDYIAPRIVSLPLFPAMTNKQVDIVSDAVLKTNLLIV